jgi:Big-like domain-containing protein
MVSRAPRPVKQRALTSGRPRILYWIVDPRLLRPSGTLRRAAAAALVVLLGPAPSARSQQEGGMSRYEMMYGQPVDVSLEDLVSGAGGYQSRAIRTKGHLGIGDAVGSSRSFVLEEMGARVLLQPVPEVSGNFERDGMALMGHELEVTGLYEEFAGAGTVVGATAVRGRIVFWTYVDLSLDTSKGPLKAPQVSLEALLTTPGRRDGQLVRVVGKFRGRNLYGDLPTRSQRASSDWVIKDDVYAIWVVGKKPKGPGWELDTGLKRDTGKWLAVIGRPVTQGGVTYVRALQVSLASPPTPTSDAQAPPPPPPKPKVPPVVVFALPLDGDSDVPPDSRFVVQFSKDMDEGTFSGHITLRYVGGLRAGDRDLDGLRLTYDRGRRALTVDPGDVLRGGREVELLLLPGIVDIDGLALTPRPGKKMDGVVDVLRFQIRS